MAFQKAIASYHLKEILLKPIESYSETVIHGEIRSCDKDCLYIHIFEEGFDVLRDMLNDEQMFEINFCINRTPYRLQQLALEIVESRGLFDVLINIPHYESNIHNLPTASVTDFKFVCTSADTLNNEQKVVIVNITQPNKRTWPYLLFGPAGKNTGNFTSYDTLNILFLQEPVKRVP